MRSTVKHTRLDFEPLNISCSIECTTPFSPLAQVSNALLNEYEPDRAASPCVIRPYVMVKDKDAIFPDGNANARLSTQSIKWKFNGVDIKDIPDFAGKYEIITTNNELKGSLKLYRNTPVTETWIISFEAQFEDWRRPKVETVQSNELSMFTTDLGEDLYRISVDIPHIIYNPVHDNLLLYDYMLANNLIPAGDRNAYKDERSFEKAVTLVLNSGATNMAALPAGITVQLFEIGSPTAIVPGSIDNPEVQSIAFPLINFDLRLIETKEYEVRVLRDAKQLAKAAFSIRREEEKVFECFPSYGSDVSPHQLMYYNSAIVNIKKETLSYPELYYKIVWYTEARIYDSVLGTWISAGEKKHNIGTKLEIPLSDTGVGVTKNDNYFSVGFDIEPQGAGSIATDEAGNAYTDESGNLYII